MILIFCLNSQRLESEKESLERDLVFKADQARQYDMLLENVRENNRQLQVEQFFYSPPAQHRALSGFQTELFTFV